MKRSVLGAIAALASMAALTCAMLPLRAHLSIATTALVLVVPVVIGVVIGGFVAGLISVVGGFLVYDFFFIPPYLTLLVGASQNWVALGVYVVVMLPVARVVAGLNATQARERRQSEEIRRLFELSDLLLEDKPLEQLLAAIVTTLAGVFAARQVAIYLPDPAGRMEIAASAGDPPGPGDDLQVLALTAAGRPVGQLALSADAAARHEREPLLLFANQVALAVERVQLREQALRARLTEEMARVAKTLVVAVAHDLRAPLALIKGSSSTLADPEIDIPLGARENLARLIDVQADRLADLVQNLLDMSRIQAGVLNPRSSVIALGDLVASVVADLTPALRGHRIDVGLPADLPPVDVDQVLIARVFTNLLENAIRHSPKRAPITIGADLADEAVLVSVSDSGPGVAPERRERIFALDARREGDVGAGLGLTIARTFVEAHGQRIWVDDAPEGGARFCFTLPLAAPIPEESQLAARARH